MSGFFDDKTKTNSSTTNAQAQWDQSNLMKDPRYATSMASYFDTYNPSAIAASDNLNPHQVTAANQQTGVAASLDPAQATATSVGSTGISNNDMDRFENRYTDQVVDASVDDFFNMRDRAVSGISGDAASRGALGNFRNRANAEATWDANNQAGLRKDIGNLRREGFTTAANLARDSGALQLQGAQTAGSLAGAETGANQALAGMGEQQRVADLTEFQIADQMNKGLAVASNVYGREGAGVSEGTGTQTTRNSPSLGSIIGGLLPFFSEGGAVNWPTFDASAIGGNEVPGFLFGGSPGIPGGDGGGASFGDFLSKFKRPSEMLFGGRDLGTTQSEGGWSTTTKEAPTKGQEIGQAAFDAVGKGMQQAGGGDKKRSGDGGGAAGLGTAMASGSSSLAGALNQQMNRGYTERNAGGEVEEPRINQKVRAATALFKELQNGGAANAPAQGTGFPAAPQELPGFEGGGPADKTTYVPPRPQAGEPYRAPAGPAPAPPAEKPGWDWSKGVQPLNKESPVGSVVRSILPMRFLDGGVFEGKPMTPEQRRAAMFFSIKSPTMRGPWEGMAEQMHKFDQGRLEQAKVDQHAAGLLGKLNGQPTLDAQRLANESTLLPARKGALEAQGVDEQVYIKAVESVNERYAKDIQRINDTQLLDKTAATPAGQRRYLAARQQAEAWKNGQMQRLQRERSGASTPSPQQGDAPVAPTVPRVPAPRVRNEGDLYGGQQ